MYTRVPRPSTGAAAEAIAERVRRVQERIAAAEVRYGRAHGSVQLLAVSKRQCAARVRAAAECGLRRFGENRLQEAQDKRSVHVELDLEWHFIGVVQTNKTRGVAEGFDWVHSVDRLKTARRLSAQRSRQQAPLQVCLQVHVGGEISKAGVELSDLPALAEAVADLPGLELRGLMAIPPPEERFEAQRRHFTKLRAAFESLNRHGHRLDTLSMGMSADLEAAIAEGATVVRVGTAIFGPRE